MVRSGVGPERSGGEMREPRFDAAAIAGAIATVEGGSER